MNVKAFLIAGASMMVTMIVVTHVGLTDMQEQSASGSTDDGAIIDGAPPTADPANSGFAGDGDGFSDAPADGFGGTGDTGGFDGTSDAIDAASQAAAAATLAEAETAALACVSESGSYVSCTGGLPPDVRIDEATVDSMTFSQVSEDGISYFVKLDASGTCHYTSADNSSCSVW